MFVKRVYMKLIDQYFPNASFFKPAGDGLLITIPYAEESLDEIVVQTIASSLRLLVDFGSLCDDDPMINFEVPREVGIGLSRGVACCLVSGDGDKVLDYSGRVLNLASRLTEVARPSGIVFDAGFVVEPLSDVLAQSFAKHSIYLKGIAQRETIDIFYTKEYTRISPVYKHPIEELEWETVRHNPQLRDIKKAGGWFAYDLPSEPTDSGKIVVRITHPAVTGGKKQEGVVSVFHFPHKYQLVAGQPQVVVDFDALGEKLAQNDVKTTWPVLIEVSYPKKWA